MHTPPHLAQLIVVEDSDADFAALKRSLRKLDVRNEVQRFEDADEAFLFLQDFCKAQSTPQPVIVLLDLNLPGTDGRDFIIQAKQSDILKAIPIIVFSTSSNPKDIEFAYANGVNGYMIKPVNTETFYASMESFKHYWLEINRLT
ncbi:MAG: response regulator [Elainellaceae cyanobacterium]